MKHQFCGDRGHEIHILHLPSVGKSHHQQIVQETSISSHVSLNCCATKAELLKFVFGILPQLRLADTPGTAKCLTPAERLWLQNRQDRLVQEKQDKARAAGETGSLFGEKGIFYSVFHEIACVSVDYKQKC